jgi:hypothetical protein
VGAFFGGIVADFARHWPLYVSIPVVAARMASIACDTVSEQLIKPAEVVARLDAARIAQEIEKPLLAGIEDIVREVAGHYRPGLWESDVDSVFDLKGMVVTSLVKDKRLLNRIFQEAGAKEFKFPPIKSPGRACS